MENDTLTMNTETDEKEWDRMRSDLRDRYRFYITNPAYTKGVSYSLWIQEDDCEYPILHSNTGGFTSFNSREKTVGNGIEPTEEFLDLLGIGFHEAMCFMPDSYFGGGRFEESYTSLYGGKPRHYEVWAAHAILKHIILNEEIIIELEPLAQWAGEHTEFSVPALENYK